MIKTVNGNIFDSGAHIIVHQVNCTGRMGSGIALQVKQRYPHVFKKYSDFCSSFKNKKDLLGQALIIPVAENTRISVDDLSTPMIANLFGQNSWGFGIQHTDYDALRQGFNAVKNITKLYSEPTKVTIAIPYNIGCYRGGGDWDVVFKMIGEVFIGCNVTLYRLDVK